MRGCRFHAAVLVAGALLVSAMPSGAEQLERPGAGLPTFGPPPTTPPPQGVRQKTDALLNSVAPDQPAWSQAR
jgi:hypothetical protein